ncbi:hypothetical protein M3Y99_01850600 [Aphelenchoides fujianensis]|nr:hypothetical protein M3Y99_01850600 [Aphelenchoides fujianensis]
MNGQHWDRHPFHDPAMDFSLTTGLTLDPEKRLLFYLRTRATEESAEMVVCGLYNRTSCRVVAENVQAFHLGVFQNFLLWTSMGESGTNPNPCAVRNGGCSHFCLLTPGVPWFSCSCPVGIRLMADQRTCDPRGVQKVLLIAAASGLFFMSLDTNEHIAQSIPFVLPDSKTPKGSTPRIVAVEYDPILPVPSEKVTDATAIALDTNGRNLVWLDSTNGRIELLNLRSVYALRQTIVSHDLREAGALAVDPSTGHGARIERVWADGSNRKVLVRSSGANWISSIVVDAKSDHIFWVEREAAVLMAARLHDGQNARVLAENLRSPHSIAKMGQTIYCTSLGGRTLTTIRIHERPTSKSAETTSEISESLIYGQMAVRAVQLEAERGDEEACGRGNGGCEQICVPLPNKQPRCLCSFGFELQANNRSCIRPSTFLVLSLPSVQNDLFRLSARPGFSAPSSLNIPNVTSAPSAVAFNPATEEVVFVSDFPASSSNGGTSSRLVRAFVNGTSSSVLLEDRALRSVRGLAVDWATGNIYWSNGQLKRVEVMSKDGRIRRTIAWTRIDPQQLAVDASSSTLLFVDCFGGSKCTVRRCPLSGDPQDGEVLFELESAVRSFTFDPRTSQLVWTDDGKIWVAGAKGEGPPRELFSSTHDGNPIGPIASFGGQIFFFDHSDGSIRRLRFNTSPEVVHASVGANLTSLLVAHSSADIPPLPERLADALKECEKKATDSVVSNSSVCAPITKKSIQKSGQCTPPDRFVLMAAKDRFLRFKIDQKPKSSELVYDQSPFVVLPIENVGHPLAVGFDSGSPNRFVYWIDGFDRDGADVKRASDRGGSGRSTRHLELGATAGCAQFFDLVVDALGRQLFASCAHAQNNPAAAWVHVWRILSDDQLVHVGHIVDGGRRSATTGLLPSPRRLAVFNRLKVFFYTDENPSLDAPTLNRCTLNGRYCDVVVDQKLQFHATRLTADLAAHRLLYTTEDGVFSRGVWRPCNTLRTSFYADVDEETNSKISSLLDFSQVTNIAAVDDQVVLMSVMTSARYDDSLFELPTNNRTVYRVGDLSPAQWTAASDEQFKRKTAILVVGTPASGDSFAPVGGRRAANGTPCSRSTCTGICVAARDQRKETRDAECLCTVGFHAAPKKSAMDERTVRTKATRASFTANTPQRTPDEAKDGSSTPTSWICDDRRQSIPRYQLCDGSPDCNDQSDELYCRCPSPSTQFDCSSTTNGRGKEAAARTEATKQPAFCPARSSDSRTQDGNHEKIQRFLAQNWNFALLLVGLVISLLLFLLCIAFCLSWRNRRMKSRARRDLRSTQSDRSLVEVVALRPLLHSSDYPIYATLPTTHTHYVPSPAPRHPLSAPSSTSTPHLWTGVETMPASAHLVEVPQLPAYAMGAGEGLATATASLVTSSGGPSWFLPAPQQPPHRFYAPPPSVASVSTYGIPVGIRYAAVVAAQSAHHARNAAPDSSSDQESSTPPSSSPERREKRRKRRRRRAARHPPTLVSLQQSAGRQSRSDRSQRPTSGHSALPPPYHV